MEFNRILAACAVVTAAVWALERGLKQAAEKNRQRDEYRVYENAGGLLLTIVIDQLHLCNQISFSLILRHEGTGPCGRIFDKGSCKWDAGFVGISDGVSDSGIRNTGYHVRFYIIPAGQKLSALIAHIFHVDAFVGGSGIAVVNYQNGLLSNQSIVPSSSYGILLSYHIIFQKSAISYHDSRKL